jgi:hypothetical protein
VRGWMVYGRTAAMALGVMSTGLQAVAAPMRRAYVDRPNGVSFSYPAGWLLNGDDDAATAKLRITNAAQPVAVVQLEGNFVGEGPYEGTDFEAGAFAYVVVPHETEVQCMATLDHSAEKQQQPVATTWDARRLDAKYSIAGTEDAHQIVATYRPGRCYLFEAVIVSKSARDGVKPLTPERWRLIRGQFAGVMQSVRLTR